MKCEEETVLLSNEVPESEKINKTLIYVVDDQSSMGVAIAAILRREGLQVKWHMDPESALRYLSKEEEAPVLLLTDFMMDPMDGLELIERFKELRPNMKAILFSGYSDEEIFRKDTIKPDAFMTKPFNASTLVARIKSVLAA